MGFLNKKEVIEENDLVILYVNFNTMYPVYVREKGLSKKGAEVENIYQTKYGSLKAMDLVGAKYGSKVQLSRGFAFALHPTPELWTRYRILASHWSRQITGAEYWPLIGQDRSCDLNTDM